MSTADDYLRRVRRHLYGIAPNRRREVMADLRAHFADAAELGLPMDEVIANLGSPDEVATRAREEFGGEVVFAENGWRVLVWAAVTVAAVTAVVLVFLSPGGIFAEVRYADAVGLSTPLLLAVPVALAAAPLIFPRRLRTISTVGAAAALTFACVIGGLELGAFFAPSCVMLWAALIVWVRLRGDGFGPLWHLGLAVLAAGPAVAVALSTPFSMLGMPRRYAAYAEAGFDPFAPLPWAWAVLVAVGVSAVLIAFGIRFAGWMLAAVGCAMVVFALVAGGALTLWLLALGGLWLTLGLMHALATPLRD